MTTTLDSFVLEFGLDPRQFTRGQERVLADLRKLEDAAQKTGSNVETEQKKVNDILASFRREAATTLALFFGGRGAAEFVSFVTNLDASTGRLARTIGMATSETSAWQGAIRQAGGTTEGTNAALAGLSGEMSRFQLTGQSQMLPVLSRLGLSLYDQNRNLKDSGTLWLELAQAVEGLDPRQAQAFLQMIPGANQEMINFALLGRRAMEEYLRSARAAGTTTAQSAAEAQAYQRAIEQLSASSTSLGRNLVTFVAPAINAVTSSLAKLIQTWNTKPGSKEDVEQSARLRNKMVGKFGSPADFMRWIATPQDGGEAWGLDAWILRKADDWYGAPGHDQEAAARAALAARLVARRMNTGREAGSNEMEAYIRQAAAARGMDPDVAIAVAKSEGLYTYKSTIPGEESFGPYQLHYGGGGQTGGMAAPGLGDVFTKQTGLDARDPGTWKQQVDFSLDQARSQGWGPWHGWKGAPFAGIPQGAGGGRSVTVNVGGVTVNTSSGNGDGIARDIDTSLSRSLSAGAVNYGAQ